MRGVCRRTARAGRRRRARRPPLADSPVVASPGSGAQHDRHGALADRRGDPPGRFGPRVPGDENPGHAGLQVVRHLVQSPFVQRPRVLRARSRPCPLPPSRRPAPGHRTRRAALLPPPAAPPRRAAAPRRARAYAAGDPGYRRMPAGPVPSQALQSHPNVSEAPAPATAIGGWRVVPHGEQPESSQPAPLPAIVRLPPGRIPAPGQLSRLASVR